MSPEDQNKAIEQFTRGDTTAVNEARRQAEQLRTQRVSEQQLVKQLGFLIKEAPKGEKDPSQEFIAGRLGLAEAVRGSVSTLDETQLNKLIDLINEMRELGAEQAVVEQKLLGPEANYEASNAQLQGALRQIIPLLNLSAENADAFGKALKSAGDVKSKELFKVLIGVFQQFGISANAQRNILQKLNDETDKAGKEAKSTANKTADLTEKLTNFSDSLRKAIAEQSLRNKLINVERNSLEQRTQLILDGNKKLLDKIRSQFTLSQKDLDNKLIQSQTKFDTQRIQLANKTQEDLLKITSDSFNKEFEQARKKATKGGTEGLGLENIQNEFREIVEKINEAISSGATGPELLAVLDRAQDNLQQGTGLGGELGKELFFNLRKQLEIASDAFVDATKVLDAERKKELNLIRLRNREVQKQILLDQQLNFARGAESAPEEFLQKINQARADVFFGRRAGDTDRATGGLVQLAKTFSGLSLGGINPGEKFLRQVTDEFAKNLETVVAQETDGPVTEGMRKEIRELAKLRAEELIKPNKPLEDNTAATKANTAALIGIARAQGFNMAAGGDMAGPSGRGTGPASGGRDYSRSGPNAGARMNARGAYSDAPRSAGQNSPLIGPGVSETPNMFIPNPPPPNQDKPKETDLDEVLRKSLSGIRNELEDLLGRNDEFEQFRDDREFRKSVLQDFGVEGVTGDPKRLDEILKFFQQTIPELRREGQSLDPLEKKFYNEATNVGSIYVDDEKAREVLNQIKEAQYELNKNFFKKGKSGIEGEQYKKLEKALRSLQAQLKSLEKPRPQASTFRSPLELQLEQQRNKLSEKQSRLRTERISQLQTKKAAGTTTPEEDKELREFNKKMREINEDMQKTLPQRVNTADSDFKRRQSVTNTQNAAGRAQMLIGTSMSGDASLANPYDMGASGYRGALRSGPRRTAASVRSARATDPDSPSVRDAREETGDAPSGFTPTAPRLKPSGGGKVTGVEQLLPSLGDSDVATALAEAEKE